MSFMISLKKSSCCGALCVLVAIAGCSTSNSQTGNTAIGGVGGAVAGAGLGAGIGAIIANGDIGASALLGTAIGLPVGLAVGYYYSETVEARELAVYENQVNDNHQEITDNQRRIEQLREELRDEGRAIQPDEHLRDYYYTGASIGTYRR